MSATALEQEITQLKAEVSTLQADNEKVRQALARAQQQINWYKRQLFGSKSEKRLDIDPVRQADLLAEYLPSTPGPTSADDVDPPARKPRRRGRKQRPDQCVTDTGLRFDASVPVREIELPCPEIEGLDADDYERIGEKRFYKLAQRPAAYEVICYVRPTYKLKSDLSLVSAPPPPAVLERSFADTSLLAGMLCDKFLYHMPLYRQHQRLEQAGITLSRQSLTHLSQRAIDLLEPICQAQMRKRAAQPGAGDGRDADQGGSGEGPQGQDEAGLVLADLWRC